VRDEQVLARASFHPNLRIYRYVQVAGLMLVSVVGILALPIWLVGGWWWSERYWELLECELGERTLSIAYGIWFRTEKSIPLEQIQDVSVRHGPLLDWLGLTKLRVETAGQGSEQAAGNLVGVERAVAFRDRILEQRERLSDRRSAAGAPAEPSDAGPGDEAVRPGTAAAVAAGEEVAGLLSEIRDAVLRIERRLEERV
jgi:putative membrane protein